MEKTNIKDIESLAELSKKINADSKIMVSREILENVCEYCENMAIYDKLGNYGDFYYKIKSLIK